MFKVNAKDKTSLKISKLGNGISCYLISSKRVSLEIYLVLNVGSRNDELDKRGIAHYLEHMLLAFEKVEEEKLGAINKIWGCTNFEETVYHITTTNKVEDIKKTLKIIKKIIEGNTLIESNLEKVRQDIIEEWDFQVNYQGWATEKEKQMSALKNEIQEKLNLVVLPKDNQFKQRNDIFPCMKSAFEVKRDFPVGSLNHIKSINFEDVKAFHQNHYVGAEVSLLVIGDINSNQIINIFEQEIKFEKKQDKLSKSKVEIMDSNQSCGVLTYNQENRYEITVYFLKGQKHFLCEKTKKYNVIEKIAMFMLTQYIEDQLIKRNYEVRTSYTETVWLMENNKLYSISIEFETCKDMLLTQKEIVTLLKSYRVVSLSYYDRRQLKRMMMTFLSEDKIDFLVDICIGECIYKEAIHEILDIYKWIKQICLQLTVNSINQIINSIINDTEMYIYCNETNYKKNQSVVERFNIN